METQKITSGDFFKSMQIIHFALMAGIFFFLIVAIFLQFNGFGTMGEEFNTIIIYVTTLFVLFGIAASHFISKRKLQACINKSTLLEKMNTYREVLVLKFALLEAPSFLAIVSYMLTGNLYFVGLTVLMLAVFVVFRPTKAKAIVELHLDQKEQQVINKPDAIIE